VADIPPTLRICDRTYSVTIQPMVNALGCCSNSSQEITIDSDAHPETQASVLVHEVFEAVNASMNLNLRHKTIAALETAWYGVLVENPAWWKGQK
jgi:hypothetical protein